MTIDEMHERFITMKRQGQGAYHSREEIDRFLNDASKDKFTDEKKLFEVNGFISDNLRNFKTSGTVTFTAGFGPLPALYAYRTNAATIVTPPALPQKVEIVPEGEWIERINDPIAVPSATDPICAIRNEIQIYPASVVTMTLYYLKKPATMVFGYTTDGDGNTTYDSGSSTDCDWADEESQIDIIIRALTVYAGVSLPDQVLIQARQIKKSTESV